MRSLTLRKYLAWIVAWALVGGIFTYVAVGWAAQPLGCDGECQMVRRVMTLFAAVFTPIFASINVTVRHDEKDGSTTTREGQEQ
jgi:hypothetical protein